METEQQTFFDKNGNEVVVDVPKRKRKNNGGCFKWAVIIVGALFLLGFCGAMLGDSGDELDTEETTEEVAEQTEEAGEEISEEETEETVIETTATEIIDTYGNNELQGEEKFGGKRVLLTGVVDDVIISGNEVYLRLKSTTEEYWLESLEAYFSQDHKKGLSTINSGDTVTLEGTVDGLTMFGNVKIIDSEVIE